ncbi:MAG: 30S ribosomal protein S6 [Chlamydiae bacterium]|nr:30S ribosomal protein S6 [Chlamydiota bacterium]
MSQTKTNLYEGMYIISSTLNDDARNKAMDKILEGITSRGGEIMKNHDFGRRRLAYEICGHREGHYYVIYFNVDSQAIKEMKLEYRLMEDLVRHMVTTPQSVMEKIEFKTLESE